MDNKYDPIGHGWSNWPEVVGKARNSNKGGALVNPPQDTERGGEQGLSSCDAANVTARDEDLATLHILLYAAHRALSALETPDDLSPAERVWVIEDLALALANYENSP